MADIGKFPLLIVVFNLILTLSSGYNYGRQIQKGNYYQEDRRNISDRVPSDSRDDVYLHNATSPICPYTHRTLKWHAISTCASLTRRLWLDSLAKLLPPSPTWMLKSKMYSGEMSSCWSTSSYSGTKVRTRCLWIQPGRTRWIFGTVWLTAMDRPSLIWPSTMEYCLWWLSDSGCMRWRLNCRITHMDACRLLMRQSESG